MKISIENRKQMESSANDGVEKISVFQKLSRSNFVWFIAALLLTEVFLYYGKPLKFVHVQGTMLKDNDYVGTKINSVLSSSNKNDALILGDSTADSLCCHADIHALKVKETSETRYNHITANFGNKIFQNELGLPVNFKNLYFGGCLISDQALMLSKLLDRGNVPKIAILTVVPRPFVDTTIDTKISPVVCFFNNRHSGLEHVKNFFDLVEYGLNSVSSIFRTHSDYATVLSSWACSTFNKPLNSYVADGKAGINSNNKVSIFGREEILDSEKSANPEEWAHEVDLYKKAYVFDQKKFDYQYVQHQTMLNRLKENGITTIVLQLPLSQSNLSLLDPNVLSIWKKRLNSAANDTGATMIDLQANPQFTESDFIDGVHLKGSGGVKVWRCIIEHLKMHPERINQVKNKN